MTTLSHEPMPTQERPTLVAVLSITQMWASLAIMMIWFAVLISAVYGSDLVERGVPGDLTTIPSGVAVALFASIATWAVAKYGFGRDGR